MKADTHLHSEFSDDSRTPMEDQIERAIALDMDAVCFTDHVDYGIKRDWDDPRGVLYRQGDGVATPAGSLDPVANVRYPAYFEKLEAMKKRYAGKLDIRAGLEFGLQEQTIPEYRRLYGRWKDHLDFVLLSVHQIGNRELWNQDFQRGKTQLAYNRRYYEEILRVMREYHDYQSIAHLNLIIRYDQAGEIPLDSVRDLVEEILLQAIREDKAVEVNTSGWHYGLNSPLPGVEILRLYHALGGKLLTLGSDAHTPEYLGDHMDDAREMLREIGFSEFCVFRKGVPELYPL